jgi:hypothetical protein
MKHVDFQTEPCNSTLDPALALAGEGFNVFPLRPRSKAPLHPTPHPKGTRCRGECGQIGHGAWDGTTDPERICVMWSNPAAGVGINLGDDLVAFDIDFNHGGTVLAAFPPTRTHYSGRGNGNRHLIFRYEPGSLASQLHSGNGARGPLKSEGMDLKIGRGSYLVAPPSTHEETGLQYTVGDENGGKIHTITDDELRAIFDEAGVSLPSAREASGPAAKRETARGTVVPTGSLLSDLLQHPPAEGGRNDWFTRVCGHLAKMHRDKPDLYSLYVNDANQKLPQPLEPAEVDKTAQSIWNTEHA